MTEQQIWKGTSSEVVNFWWFFACLLIIPIPWAIAAHLRVKCRVYTLTNERLMIESGVFSKTQDMMELYRVRDVHVTLPFWMRMFGLENVHLLSTDLTSERVVIEAISSGLGLSDKIRDAVEECRKRKGVREIGLDLDPGQGGVDFAS